MANPQPDKYIKISSELWDAFCRVRIAGEARQMLDTIIRKTYGYHKKEDRISTSQFMELTGLPNFAIHKARKKLVDMKMITITKKGNSQVLIYSLQKDYDKWKLLPKKVTVTKKGNDCNPKRSRVLPKKVTNCNPKSDTQKIIDNTTIDTYTIDKDFSQAFKDYLEMRKKIKRPATARAQELVLKMLHKYSIKIAIGMLEQSILNSWQGVFPLKGDGIQEISTKKRGQEEQDKIRQYRKDAENEELIPKEQFDNLRKKAFGKKV